MPKKVQPAGRPDKRKKQVLRPTSPGPQAAPRAGAAEGPVVTAPTAAPIAPARSTWGAAARTSSRNAGTIRTEDYHYIYSDLRRIGILAGSIIVVLIALTFVLR